MKKLMFVFFTVLLITGCNSQPKALKAPCDRDGMFCGEKTKINTGDEEWED